MTNIMIDLETASARSDAAILSIGAVKFGPSGIDGTFYQAVDFQSHVDVGGRVSDDTIEWWTKRSEQARAVWTDPNRVDIRDALIAFSRWAACPDLKIWGNGATFDNVVLVNAYHSAGLKAPWEFWNDRCYRTAVAGRPRIDRSNGTHHNALDDAVAQAKHFIRVAPEMIL